MIVNDPDEERFLLGKRNAVEEGRHRAKKRLEAMAKRNKVEVEPGCEHKGFVVRDIQGDDRFLCRECNARFPRHPQVTKSEPQDSTMFYQALDVMTDFRQGMKTFSDACKQASMSAEEFKKALIDAFPPVMEYTEVQTMSRGRQRVPLGESPQRTSDPEAVDSIFPTPGVDPAELLRVWEESFPDITEVNVEHDDRNMCRVMKFDFVDGTTQRVEISDKEIWDATNPPTISQFTHPIVKQNYPSSLFTDPKRID